MNEKIRLRDIAGFCPEEAVWKMMADISNLISDDKMLTQPNPDSILVDGDSFIIDSGTVEIDAFLAPEQYDVNKKDIKQKVWALGATAYFMATGHTMFGGFGGKYQNSHPNVPLPNMPKPLHLLTPVIHKCITCIPSERISPEELKLLATKGLENCSRQHRGKIANVNNFTVTKNGNEDKWPEKMIES